MILLPLLFPLLGSLLLILLGRQLSRRLAGFVGCAASGLAFFSSLFLILSRRPTSTLLLGEWFRFGSLRFPWAFLWDPLSSVMVFLVGGVGLLIHIYSLGYMEEDPSLPRFFALMNLFTFFMSLLALSSNLAVLFLGWEGVGLCSYLLIGFWNHKERAVAAGTKAFLFNRVGDLGFLLGLFWLFKATGTVDFQTLDSLLRGGSIASATATPIALLLFCGVAGKSAQLPLSLWLPDAMEGPTPVSAFIHAATMVTAGIFLMVRLNGLFFLAPGASTAIGWVGGLTALFGGFSAIAQRDIKKVLAYSTISQLGYMVMAVGAGAFAASFFHLATHAFFKALLFLAAGCVIHALRGEQDLFSMGGLRKDLPKTGVLFFIGAAALAGIPGFSGSFSKDWILSSLFLSGHQALWALGLLVEFLTAFYIFRLYYLAFHGSSRSPERQIHKPSATMLLPLLLLALPSLLGGLLSLPAFLALPSPWRSLMASILLFPEPFQGAHGTELLLTLLSAGAALVGFVTARRAYAKAPPSRDLPSPLLEELSKRAFSLDTLLERFLLTPYSRLSAFLDSWVERRGIDRGVCLTGDLFQALAGTLSRFQDGRLHRSLIGLLATGASLLTLLVLL